MRLDEVWFPMDLCAIVPKSPPSVLPSVLPVCLSVCPGSPWVFHPSGRAGGNAHWAWPRALGLAKGTALVSPDGLTIRHNTAL